MCVHLGVKVESLPLSFSAYSHEAWSLPEPGAYVFMLNLETSSPPNPPVSVPLGVGGLGSLHGCWILLMAEQVVLTAEPYLRSLNLLLPLSSRK